MKFLLCLLAIVPALAEPRVVRTHDISPVWAGHPVGFDLLTTSGRQFVAFYDAERRMTVAARQLGSTEWKFARLDSTLGWDSHNYVVIAADEDGYLHVSGNMHVKPLVYFRSAKPWDIDSFEAVHKMTGMEEKRCTYPRFLRGARNELIFTYRDGSSGSGNEIYNIYDTKTRTWRRLLDQPLTDGEGLMNAYPAGPVRGPDGWFHMLWVWRDTPDCSTNHDLSYARSRDLRQWQTSGGKPLSLPIRLNTLDIVDPVPAKGGLLNGGARLGFDSSKRPVVTYFKFDEKGRTQAIAARLEDGEWKKYWISDWDYRWEFSGGGSIVREIRVGAVRRGRPGELLLDYDHVKYGAGVWRLDESTLKVVGAGPVERPWPEELDRTSFEGAEVHRVTGSGKGLTYVLRWETLGANRDRPRTGPLPAPQMLRLYEIVSEPARP